jgi:histidine ammonia-lyase
LGEREKRRVRESRRTLEGILEANPGKSFYGVNTGVGAFLDRCIPEDRVEEFQENLIVSHACGVGYPLEAEIVRGIMLHMILNLKKGFSSVKLETLELLVEMFNRGILPVVPAKGSVGASGDLVPQAHIGLALIGKDRQQVVRSAGLEPVRLGIGEAIALLNGTGLMTSFLAFLVYECDNLIKAANLAAAMSVEALGCNPESFEPEVQSLRPHSGQIAAASDLNRMILKRRAGRTPAHSLQDAYSLRCIPQVHGAFREALARAREVVNIEINSFGGNPWVSNKGGRPEIHQASGNFHGQLLSQIADTLSIALCSLSSISERRIDRLLNCGRGGLPLFLAHDEGLDTGLMITQYTAAALVSESKTLAHPASVDSIPVSGGQEDFVSMGAWAVRKAWEVCRNTEHVIAIEILCAAQALSFRPPLPAGSAVAETYRVVRDLVSDFQKGRVLAEDIGKLYELIRNGQLLKEAGIV